MASISTSILLDPDDIKNTTIVVHASHQAGKPIAAVVIPIGDFNHLQIQTSHQTGPADLAAALRRWADLIDTQLAGLEARQAAGDGDG